MTPNLIIFDLNEPILEERIYNCTFSLRSVKAMETRIGKIYPSLISRRFYNFSNLIKFVIHIQLRPCHLSKFYRNSISKCFQAHKKILLNLSSHKTISTPTSSDSDRVNSKMAQYILYRSKCTSRDLEGL